MPNKAGRFTRMELSFVESMAKHRDSTFAAYQAGYSFPVSAGSKLARQASIKEAVRQETQRYLYEEAGALAVSTLAEVSADKRFPVGARVKAATELAKLANIGVTDQQAGKPDSELTAAELDAMRRKLEVQRAALESVLTALPRQTIEATSIFD